MKTITNRITILMIFTMPFLVFSQGQPFLSKNWSNQGGEMAMFYKNATTTDNSKNVYVAGATLNGYGNYDILIQKFNPKGALLGKNLLTDWLTWMTWPPIFLWTTLIMCI